MLIWLLLMCLVGCCSFHKVPFLCFPALSSSICEHRTISLIPHAFTLQGGGYFWDDLATFVPTTLSCANITSSNRKVIYLFSTSGTLNHQKTRNRRRETPALGPLLHPFFVYKSSTTSHLAAAVLLEVLGNLHLSALSEVANLNQTDAKSPFVLMGLKFLHFILYTTSSLYGMGLSSCCCTSTEGLVPGGTCAPPPAGRWRTPGEPGTAKIKPEQCRTSQTTKQKQQTNQSYQSTNKKSNQPTKLLNVLLVVIQLLIDPCGELIQERHEVRAPGVAEAHRL